MFQQVASIVSTAFQVEFVPLSSIYKIYKKQLTAMGKK